MTTQTDLRTKNSRSQSQFDTFIGSLTIEELRVLSRNYHTDIIRIKQHCRTESDLAKLKRKQQRYKMINEEISKRGCDISASPSYYDMHKNVFDSNSGIVYDCVEGKIVKKVAFNEDEDEIVEADDD